ncbi:MAG TPA: hypothetical protein VIM61_01740 [Chthoniobacterales bacterium]|jgi:hypothetical protein
MLSARRQFLDAFLGALGAAEIVESLERETELRGTLRFAEDSEVIDLSGDEGGDLQDFVWPVREEDAPSLLAYRIADVLQRYQLVEIDRLRVSRETLLAMLRNDFDEPVGDGEFDEALGELFAIEVAMVEDGAETGDVFRIRE